MNGVIAALMASAMGISAYIGHSIGYQQGWDRRDAHITENQRRDEWVTSIMQPLWADMCRALPDKCQCAPRR